MVGDINALVFNRPPKDILPPVPKEFRKEFWEYIDEFMDFMGGVIRETERKKSKKQEWLFKTSKQYPEEIQKLLIPTLLSIYRTFKYPSVFYNMALTQLITLSEDFLSGFIQTVLVSNPNMLKSEKMVTYEAILSFSSMKKMENYLADEISKEILEENIDKMAEKINRRFSIDISKFIGFEMIREAFYRRNVIVHNNCVADEKYCQKVKKSKIGQQIETDFKYMERAFDEIGKFIDYMDDNFSKKFKYERTSISNRLLYPPDID